MSTLELYSFYCESCGAPTSVMMPNGDAPEHEICGRQGCQDALAYEIALIRCMDQTNECADICADMIEA